MHGDGSNVERRNVMYMYRFSPHTSGAMPVHYVSGHTRLSMKHVESIHLEIRIYMGSFQDCLEL